MRIPKPRLVASVSGDQVRLDFETDTTSLEITRAGWRQLCAQVTRLMNIEDLAVIRETIPGEGAEPFESDAVFTTV